MAPEIAAALISGGIALTGSVGSAGLANAKNKTLQKRAFEYEKQMIAEQNAYNSPSQQLARYKEAGLNPNLIYGDGGSSAGNQSQHATYQAPEYHVPDVGVQLGNFVQNALNYSLQKKDIQLKEQELQNMREQQFNIRAERMSKDIENMYQAAITGFDPGLVTSQEERDMVLGGMKIGKYKAETAGLEELANLRRANVALSKLDARQKDWVFNNMNQLEYDIAMAEKEGRLTENELRKISLEYEKAYKQAFGQHTGQVDKVLEVIQHIISIFVPKFSISSGNVGNTPYSRKSLSY